MSSRIEDLIWRGEQRTAEIRRAILNQKRRREKEGKGQECKQAKRQG